MSLNTSHVQNGVLLYSGEFILLYCEGVTLTFDFHEPLMKGSKKGRIYLTTHRIAFRSNEEKEGLRSFSFPFHSLFDLGLEQPVFGANFIKGRVRSDVNGGWTGEAPFKITFKNGGAIEFGQAMMAASQQAARFQGQAPPPPYSAPSQTTFANATNYMAPPTQAPYGFNIPTNVFPDQPAPNQVYMVEQPPPYPGVMGFSNQAYVGPNGTAYASAPLYPPLHGASAPMMDNMGPPPAYQHNESKKVI